MPRPSMKKIVRPRRVDANQKQIVTSLRKCGFSVAITSSLGNGFPDLVVAKNKRTVLVEIKDGTKPPSRRKLTTDESTFSGKWLGEYLVAHSFDDVLNHFQ